MAHKDVREAFVMRQAAESGSLHTDGVSLWHGEDLIARWATNGYVQVVQREVDAPATLKTAAGDLVREVEAQGVRVDYIV